MVRHSVFKSPRSVGLGRWALFLLTVGCISASNASGQPATPDAHAGDHSPTREDERHRQVDGMSRVVRSANW